MSEAVTVAPGVVAIPASTADGKLGVIAGRRAAMAVDAGINHAEGSAVAEAARALGHASVLLLYSHGHIDHVLGGSGVHASEVVAHRLAGEHILAQLPAWAEREAQPVDVLHARLCLPTLLFEGNLEVDLGGSRVRVLDAPGHAPGAVVALVEPAGVLFGSDTIVTGIPPYFRDGDGVQLERTLCRLAELGAKTLVPGHGPIIEGRDEVRAAILWPADYVARVRDHVLARLGREPADEIVAAAPYAEFIGARLRREAFRMEWRHEQAVRITIEQLSGRRNRASDIDRSRQE